MFNKHDIYLKLLELAKKNHDKISKNTDILNDDVKSEESKQEGKYDTRALLNSYLAGAQEARLKKLGSEINRLSMIIEKKSYQPKEKKDFVVLHSILTLEYAENKTQKNFIISPVLGGYKILFNNELITSVTPDTPFARTIMNKIIDDEVIIANQQATIVSIS